MVIGDTTLWQRLLAESSAPLLTAAAAFDEPSAADVQRLRRQYEEDLVPLALELTAARRLGQRKFPGRPDLVADVAGMQQATSQLVAQHKARRFAAAAIASIDDLCCGIGGDAMSLASAARVRAIDFDPVRSWMAGRNAGCDALVADVQHVQRTADAMHIDPARRDAAGRRAWRLADVRPGPPVLASLLEQYRHAAVKLGPGADLRDVLALGRRDRPSEIEVVNERGTLVQAILWTGDLAAHPGRRTATRLPGGETFTGAPEVPVAGSDGAIGSWLVTVDPAIERAALTGALLASISHPPAEIAPGLGVLTAEQPAEPPWLESWEVLHVGPWRQRHLRAWLAAHDAGLITVKTRGRAVDATAAQEALRGSGTTPFVVFILRVQRRIMAVVTQPAGG